MAASAPTDAPAPRARAVREHLLILGRQTLVYGLAGAAAQAVGIVTLPIFARVFSPSQYGVLEVATVGYSALLVIADTGLTSGAQRNYYDYNDHEEPERRSALFTGLAASVTLGTIIALGLVVFAYPVSQWVFGTPRYAGLIRIVAITVPIGTIAAFAREAMRLKFKPWRYTVSALLGSAGAAVIGVVAVVALNAGIDGVMIGTLIGTGLAAIYGFVVSRRALLGRFSRPELRTMVMYGLPLIPAAAAMWGLNFVDRVILAKLGSLAETGDYAVANRFGFVLMLLVTAFATAYGPFQLALWKEDPEFEKQMRDRTLTYLTVVLVATGVVLAVFAREIISILAPSFDAAYRVVGLLTMSVVFWGIANLVLFGIGLMRRTRHVATFTAAALAMNVALNFALIPLWGIVGASLANLIAYVFLAVAYYRKSQELYPTAYSLDKPGKVILAGAFAMAVGALPLANSPAMFALKLGVVAAFGVSLRLLRVIDEPELQEIRALAARAKRFGRA
jgi:O-antigen/teichoic acid export membrane protein